MIFDLVIVAAVCMPGALVLAGVVVWVSQTQRDLREDIRSALGARGGESVDRWS